MEYNKRSYGNQLICPDGYVSTGITCEDCGLTNVTPNVKIVGGVVANAYSWPSQALIIQNYAGLYGTSVLVYTISGQFTCGGTLINAYTILTAAHCIQTSFPYTINGVAYNLPMYFINNPYYSSLESTFKVYLGVYNKSFISLNTSPAPPIVEYSVISIIKHPSYDSTTQLNDIALLILNQSVKFDSYIKPACLPTYSTNYPLPNISTAYTAGWGLLGYGGSSPDVLYNVNLTVYNFSSCGPVSPSIQKNSSSQICAGEITGGKDTCQGDSGGAISVLDTFGGKLRYMVSGITSYGDGTCGTFPSLYTRVSYFVDWIRNNWKESDSLSTSTITITSSKLTQLSTTTKTDFNSINNDTLSAIVTPVAIVLFVVLIAIILAIIIWKKKSSQVQPDTNKKQNVSSSVKPKETLRNNLNIKLPPLNIEQNINVNKITNSPPKQTSKGDIFTFENDSIKNSSGASISTENSDYNASTSPIEIDTISENISLGVNSNDSSSKIENSDVSLNISEIFENHREFRRKKSRRSKRSKHKKRKKLSPLTEELENIEQNDQMDIINSLKSHSQIIESIEDNLKNRKPSNT